MPSKRKVRPSSRKPWTASCETIGRVERRAARHDLAENPKEAHWFAEAFNKYSSEWLNGLDRPPNS